MPQYSKRQLDAIAEYHNWAGIDQDDDGNVVFNLTAGAETGWRRATEDKIAEALAHDTLNNRGQRP